MGQWDSSGKERQGVEALGHLACGFASSGGRGTRWPAGPARASTWFKSRSADLGKGARRGPALQSRGCCAGVPAKAPAPGLESLLNGVKKKKPTLMFGRTCSSAL